MPALLPRFLSILTPLLLTAWVVVGCTALPRFDGAHPALPSAVMQSDDAFRMADGAVLPARVWQAAGGRARAVVLALHGFNDSRDAWAIPAPVFARAGITVYAPDQRGFGAAPLRGFWPGGRVLADDAAAMLRELRARYPGTPLYAMGESMGGAVLMTLAARADAPPVDGWVFLSPAVWGRRQMGPGISASLWLVSGLLPGLTLTGAEVPLKVRASDNYEALLALVRDPLTIRRTRVDALRGLTDLMDGAQAAAPEIHAPSLILYGARDTLVPADAMARAWSRMPPGTRFGYYQDGYHLLLRDLNRALPTGDVISWIEHPGAFLPSGADTAAAAWLAGHQ